MDDSVAGLGRDQPRPFAPRLVRDDDDEALAAPRSGGEAGKRWGVPEPKPGLDPDVQRVADSLADLFLGQVAAGRGPGPRVTPSATAPDPAPPAGALASSPGPVTAHAANGLVEAATAFSATPTPAAAVGARRRPDRADLQAPPIELLVLGHLPGLASAWVSQYAAQAARTLGHPVALARLEPGSATIDLFGVDRQDAPERCETPTAAIAAARGRARLWLLRVDELSEATLTESARVGAITLLTGVGEPSIVNAYKAIKAIAQRQGASARQTADGARLDDRRGLDTQGHERPDLRIALLGATPERAREASSRVRKAAGTFLGRSVGVLVCGERLGMTDGRPLYRGAFDGDARTLLDLIDRVTASDGGPGPSPSVDPGTAGRRSGEGVVAHDAGRATPAAIPAMEAQPVIEEAVAARGERRAAPRVPESVEPAVPATNPAAGEGPRARETSNGCGRAASDAWCLEPLDEDDWFLSQSEVGVDGRRPPSASDAPRSDRSVPRSEPVPLSKPASPGTPTGPRGLATLVGMATLPIVCPDAPRVEIALDAAGGLHLLVTDEMSDEAPPPASRVGSLETGWTSDGLARADAGVGRVGVAALLAAEAWAGANIALIRRALPAVKGPGITLHLMTRIPAGVRDLLGARIRVHLLVGVGGQDVCVGLN